MIGPFLLSWMPEVMQKGRLVWTSFFFYKLLSFGFSPLLYVFFYKEHAQRRINRVKKEELLHCMVMERPWTIPLATF